MRDPYLYNDCDVMKNKLGIKDTEKLENAESAITLGKLAKISNFENGKFDLEKLKAIHKHIFGDIYEWAGEVRKIDIEKSEEVLSGKSVKYSNHKLVEKEADSVIKEFNEFNLKGLNIDQIADKLSKLTAKLWQIHPFREGNTRTTISFMETFAKSKGITIDNELLKNNSGYVRKSLVMSSIGEYSEYDYLKGIVKDAIVELKRVNERETNLIDDSKTNIMSVKDRIIDTYIKELPAIKHISEKTATIIDNINNKKKHIHTIKEIKELHHEIGKKIENTNDGANANFDNDGFLEELEEFETLSEVIDDVKQAQLKLKQEQAHEKAMINQLSKDNCIDM